MMMKNNAFELLDNQNPRIHDLNINRNSNLTRLLRKSKNKELLQELISEANDVIDLMGIYGSVGGWRNSPFWQNRDIEIPWHDLNRGDVVVFHITDTGLSPTGTGRVNQIWIVKFLEIRNNKGYFSYLLITPSYDGEDIAKMKRDFCLYRGKIMSVVKEGSGVYFGDGRNRKIEWTLLSNLNPNFMNWINENPFEVKQ